MPKTDAEIRLLECPIQPYTWGSRYAIARLQGRPAPSDGPEAELWIGAHARAPALLQGQGGSLLELLAQAPETMLGPESRTRFGDALPFLLKVLAAQEPLSLQAHPSRAQARAGFAHEERARLALGDPRRNYKDANHKPELLCALEPFHALCGFRPLPAALALLERLALIEPIAPYAHLARKNGSRSLRACCEGLWELAQDERDRAVDLLLTAVRREVERGASQAEEAMYRDLLEVAEHHPGDAGLLIVPLLHHIVLAPGEALFLPSGVLHSYLHGVGIEVMANSDNVLRGGLTRKNVDVRELLRTVRFEPFAPRRFVPDPGRVEFEYEPDVEEFALDTGRLHGERTVRRRPRGPELVLATEGQLQLRGVGGEQYALPSGRAAFVPGLCPGYTIAGSGRYFIARLGRGRVATAPRLL